MHRLCQGAFRLLISRPKARYHICPPCASKLSQRSFTATIAPRGQDDDSIRYYEQTASGKVKRVDEEQSRKELGELKKHITRLEQELRKLDASGELSRQLGKDTLDVGSGTSAAGDAQDADGIKATIESLLAADVSPDGLKVDFPQHQRVHLQSFNNVLREVAGNVKDVKRNALLWIKYVKCKQLVPDFLEEIGPAAWDVLWRSQYVGNLTMDSRTKHLWELVEDMIRTDQQLSPTQKLVRIEALFSEGNRNGAIKFWQQQWTHLPKDAPSRADFRDLGIRLNAQLGRLQEAHDLALDAVESHGKPKAEDIATLIVSWAQKGDDASLKVAWSLYLDLRQRLGSTMSLEDYDHIVMSFLGANRSSLALAVFKDMVLSGKRPDWDSFEVAKKSMGIYRELQSHSTQLADLTQVSLASLSVIPKQLENKYFFASWIKRLIGMGEVDSAVSVLALMYERGIRPDAIHLNGIISAWLREEDKQNHSLALQVAWSMVRERLKVVVRRHATNTEAQASVDLPDMGVSVPPYISKNLPPATIETFSILLLYYENRSMQASMDIVQQTLYEADIAPNSFFMNHLLHGELRRGDVAAAWKRFQLMRKNVNPDIATFAVLWECAKMFTAGRNVSAKEGFPTPRTIFSNMQNWLLAQRPKTRKVAKDQFSQVHYNQIIRCFCFRRDLEGTIVAMYGLRDSFEVYPDADTVRLITIQLARMGEIVPASKRRRSRLSANKDSVRNMEKVSDIFKVVNQGRLDTLQGLGISEEQLSEKERGEETLFKLAELLRVFMRHTTGVEINETSPREEELEKVSWEMGVGGIDMGPPLHSGMEATSVHVLAAQA